MNNYYDIAEDDLFEAQDRFNAGRFKRCAIWCQQAGEKYLKYILVDKLSITGEGDTLKDKEDASIINGHNLKKVYERINEADKILNVPASTLFALTNYYTKARYPGEGYVDVDSETAAELLEHAKIVKAAVDTYLEYIPVENNLKALADKYSKQ
jgi:HEPN domain-containing protein